MTRTVHGMSLRARLYRVLAYGATDGADGQGRRHADSPVRVRGFNNKNNKDFQRPQLGEIAVKKLFTVISHMNIEQ